VQVHAGPLPATGPKAPDTGRLFHAQPAPGARSRQLRLLPAISCRWRRPRPCARLPCADQGTRNALQERSWASRFGPSEGSRQQGRPGCRRCSPEDFGPISIPVGSLFPRVRPGFPRLRPGFSTGSQESGQGPAFPHRRGGGKRPHRLTTSRPALPAAERQRPLPPEAAPPRQSRLGSRSDGWDAAALTAAAIHGLMGLPKPAALGRRPRSRPCLRLGGE
jgi:hypothetical protein